MLRVYAIAITLLLIKNSGWSQLNTYHLKGAAQGTTWQVTYFHEDSVVAQSSVDSILQVIDSSMSLYKPYSQIVQFNKSTLGIQIDSHFQKVVSKSFEVSNRTKGLFDITVGPLVKAWGFSPDGEGIDVTQRQLDSIRKCVGYQKIMLKDDSLLKLRPCITADVNGIAQGYTVDIVAGYLDEKVVQHYIVEIGGEVRVKGRRQPSGEYFRVGIEIPGDDEYSMNQKLVHLKEGALTTSGSYRKYIQNGGRRISHIIDPRTGKTIDNNIISVTVAAPDAITADAYDNGLMLMGVKRALRYVRKNKELSVFIVYRDRKGAVRTAQSGKQFTFRN
jgi:thiamine biosynthesis lipoprotein